ncbi:hypothetical protein A3D77_06440 [Candidatus Gottesmanbacteria bacterium RIFCSPHIGHO2_02_FULL_39_11]|uniref:Uncharacterized protein n=1 Tax=Candidatus Gottesmanbacteria bacterium RIFCSPHIGHO2_02_FULL_39_11 TaxID=1798382 RepID=A0A1F5ZWR8_9BACT|nr:MAG: hypothetical protein A3D77_06440 [Candidatus Gottesmanbacteria bacterium RIFCSPHIGHO2_02_FULL_39_11]
MNGTSLYINSALALVLLAAGFINLVFIQSMLHLRQRIGARVPSTLQKIVVIDRFLSVGIMILGGILLIFLLLE